MLTVLFSIKLIGKVFTRKYTYRAHVEMKTAYRLSLLPPIIRLYQKKQRK